jgi:hypothetical protein
MLLSAIRKAVRNPGLAAKIVMRNPADAWSRFYDDYVYARERRRIPCVYRCTSDWERQLHSLLGVAWPCDIGAAGAAIWPAVIATLATHGIAAGPESYLYWNDGDPGLIRAIYCLVQHLRPEKIVETGVAHGVSSRFILEALAENGSGHLWSIDLPPLKPVWQDQVGVAVEAHHRQRWTLIRDSSRHALSPLLDRLGPIDLFIHDSLHSERNLLFEMNTAWARLRPGGAMVIDDVDASWGFHSFIEAHPDQPALICEAEPLRPDRRRFNEKGLFGIVLKAPIEPADAKGAGP